MFNLLPDPSLWVGIMELHQLVMLASLSVYVHQQILENYLTKEPCDF